MQPEIGKIVDFVHAYLMETGKKELGNVAGPRYRWEHTLRVTRWAWRLAVEEKADIEKCVVSALFHDASHFVSEDYHKHGFRSAEIATEFLLKEGYQKGFVEDVAYAVESHVGEANPRTVEAKILQDADTLDRFGYIRILLFGKTAELLNLDSLKARVQSSLGCLERLEKGDFGPMWTKTGKERVAELIGLNKTLYRGVLEELENTRAPQV